MKASLYIKELKKLIDEYGDLEVCYQEYNGVDVVTFPCKPGFWFRATIEVDKKERVIDCFGSVPEEE